MSNCVKRFQIIVELECVFFINTALHFVTFLLQFNFPPSSIVNGSAFSNTQTLSTDNRPQSQSTFRLLFFLLPTNVLLRIRPVKKCWIFAVDRPIRHNKVK